MIVAAAGHPRLSEEKLALFLPLQENHQKSLTLQTSKALEKVISNKKCTNAFLGQDTENKTSNPRNGIKSCQFIPDYGIKLCKIFTIFGFKFHQLFSQKWV